MSDCISLRTRLLAGTYRCLEQLARRRGWEWFQPCTEPEWVCWLIEILKQSDDDPNLFPHGKWATIQNLQGLVAAAAAGERHSMLIERNPLFDGGPKP